MRVRATSVHADVWHSVTGYPYSWRLMSGWRVPKHAVPGSDVASVVESVRTRVTRFLPGDEVFAQTMRGFESLESKPGEVTFEQAASVPASGYIAFANLTQAGDNLHGQRALVNGAGGGVGTIALQMLRARGAHVTAVDAESKLSILRSLGAEETVDYARTNFIDTWRSVRSHL